MNNDLSCLDMAYYSKRIFIINYPEPLSEGNYKNPEDNMTYPSLTGFYSYYITTDKDIRETLPLNANKISPYSVTAESPLRL